VNDPLVEAGVADVQSPWGRHAPGPGHAVLLALAHALPERWPRLNRLVVALRRPIKYGHRVLYDVRFWGLRLRLSPRGNKSEAKLLFAPQYFDAEERDFLAQRLRPGSVFVDVGANVGAYTYWAWRCIGESGRIIAVEPDPELRARLEFNLRSNGVGSVQVVPQALSDRDGSAVLYINRAQRGENTLVSEQARAAGGDRVAVPVELRTLLGVLQARGIERVDALKIDIEGHELPVLQHFFAHAPEPLWPRALVLEHKHEAAQTLAALLTRQGYRCVLETRLNHGYER
jgi:FkbM family methyltransferase